MAGRKISQGSRKLSPDSDDDDSNDVDAAADADESGQLTVVLEEKAADRQPPNHHDLKMYVCRTGGQYGLDLAPAATIAPHITRRDVPKVQGAFVVMNVLTAAECQQIIRTAEMMGFDPDHPTARRDPTGHNIESRVTHTAYTMLLIYMY